MALNFRFHPIRAHLREFVETLRWRLHGLSVDADQAERGRFGEWSARRFLLRKGFFVIDRNWRNPNDRRDEIDLICKDREVLAFVEVRARNASARTTGYKSISPRKKISAEIIQGVLESKKKKTGALSFRCSGNRLTS